MRSKIEQQVMGSVAAIYTARQLMGPTALKLYVCAAALWSLSRLVWVERVVENLGQVGATGAPTFVVAALLNAEFVVQVTLALFVIAGLWFVRDLALSSARQPLRAL